MYGSHSTALIITHSAFAVGGGHSVGDQVPAPPFPAAQHPAGGVGQQFLLPGQGHILRHGGVGQHPVSGKEGKALFLPHIAGDRHAVLHQGVGGALLRRPQIQLQGVEFPLLGGLGLILQLIYRPVKVLPDEQPSAQGQHQPQHRQHSQQQFLRKFHPAPSNR